MSETTAQVTGFKIKHEKFEGPLELLLELVEKRKLFVGDISLAAVTDDYLSYVSEHAIPAEQVAGFVAVAATLILIKTRSLLPTLTLSEEEETSIDELERRLAAYRLIKSLAPKLMDGYGRKVLYLAGVKASVRVFAPDPNLKIATFPEIMREIFGRLPKEAPPAPERVVYKTISLAEIISTISDRILSAVHTTFSRIAVASPEGNHKSQKVYTIVSFLGMLELSRRGLIAVDQGALFEEIHIERLSQEEGGAQGEAPSQENYE